MATSDIEKVPTAIRDTRNTPIELAAKRMRATRYKQHHPRASDAVAGVRGWIGGLSREKSSISGTTMAGVATRTLISVLLLGVVLTINVYGQPPSTPASGAVAGPAATAYFIKFKVMPGKNADFEKAISEMMVGVRQKEPGNVYCDLVHLAHDPQTYAIIERYKGAKASKAHVESEYIKKLGDALKNGLLDGPPEVQELVFIRSK
jgi:quinol monooxygenase YgiN